MNASIKKLYYLLPGLLLFAAWPVAGFSFIIFFAFVPLFLIEISTTSRSRFFWILWINLLLWNVLTTWWIWNASPGGAIGAIVANSLLMCFPWMLCRYLRKTTTELFALAGFILLWLSWEYIHHNWDLSWPWLTLGNVFATHPNWVQWYEYTGTTGGSLWVLLANVLFYLAIKNKVLHNQPCNYRFLGAAFVLLLTGLGASYLAMPTTLTAVEKTKSNVVVVQPNVEPYTEKFTTDAGVLINKMIRLSESKIDSNTRLVVWPETAIPVQVWENEIAYNSYYRQVFDFVRNHPQIQLITGIDSYKNWGISSKKGFSIRKSASGMSYEAFNTAMATDASERFQLYHKSKLVPGVESLPSWLGFMSSIFDDLGGTTGTLGRSDSAMVFSFPANPYRSAPIICYESIYSDYVTEYVKRGANILTVITNDGWWGETPGYKQHMNMSRLRAIENRRWVARSANTGIGCFISPSGEVWQPQPWNKAAAIKMDIEPLEQLTFYSRNGDWISRLALPGALVMLAFGFYKSYSNRRKLLSSHSFK